MYFAAVGKPAPGKPAEELAVWALHRRVANKRVGCNTWQGWGGERRDAIVAFITAPTASNPNLAAQGGLFTLVQEPFPGNEQSLHPEWVRAIDDVVRDNETLFPEDDRPVLYQFTMPESQIPRLLRVLSELSVHAGSVYPGLAGVVSALLVRACPEIEELPEALYRGCKHWFFWMIRIRPQSAWFGVIHI